MTETYENEHKQRAWQYFRLGHEMGYGVENYTDMDEKTARSAFERQWQRNES